MTLDQHLEALLFAAAKPLSKMRLAEIVQHSPEEVEQSLRTLTARLEETGSALMLQHQGSLYELVTRPELAESVRQIATDELQTELTRPALETISILAYCGPMTRPELEQIRGVQSSQILRNLQLRGLVEEKEDTRLGQPIYQTTFQFLHHLGIPNVEALPEYASLRGHAAVADILTSLDTESPSDPPALTI